jgi:hypothetical protein
MKKTLGILAALTLLFGFSSSAVALTIDQDGVVGIMEGQVESNLTNEAIIANAILAMGESQTQPASTPPGVNCSNDQLPCEYRTGDNTYSGTVSGGFKQETNPTVLTAAALTSEYFLAKYDGPNAGYVLFNTADWIAAGNTTVPSNGSTIWDSRGSGLSHYSYFGTTSVPDGGTSLILLGAALAGLGIVRRRLNV